MIEEIRIYYECYEQANHFIRPIIKKYASAPIKLIKKSKDHNKYAKFLAPIVFWKDQDILISAIEDGNELPIIAIEFSTAVFTEDHELQRTDALAAAAENNCLYIKLSSTKKESPSGHGGNIHFDYTKPYRLIFQNTGNLCFHIEWKLLKNSNNLLETDPIYLSCPHAMPELDEIFMNLLAILTMQEKLNNFWIKIFTGSAVKGDLRFSSQALTEWVTKLKTPLKKKEDKLITNSSRTSLKKDVLEIKFNRFGHAMDPERGMLVFYGNIFPKITSKMVFATNNNAWYKDTSQEDKIQSYIKKNGLNALKDYYFAFIYASGLHTFPYFLDLLKNAKGKFPKTIDITDFAEKQYFKTNKSIRTILRYSNRFVICDNKNIPQITIMWDNNKLPNINYCHQDAITKINNRNTIEEDDVTYIVAHQILRVNGFDIISLSYPGAQGDSAILPNPGLGRRQRRSYPDIVASFSDKYLDLTENKGAFSLPAIKSDIKKLIDFRNNEKVKAALNMLLNKISPTKKGLPILLSASFWLSNKKVLAKDLPLDKIDFFIVISSDRKTWKIWLGGDLNIFKAKEGRVNLEKTFCLDL